MLRRSLPLCWRQPVQHHALLQQLWERQISHLDASTTTAASSKPSSRGDGAPLAEEGEAALASYHDDGEPRQPPPPPQPELVDQYLSEAVMNRRQLLGARKGGIIAEFARFAGDQGSPEVQVALLTDKIRDLSDHFKQHKQDKHSLRGLTGMLHQRRKLLTHLRSSNFERYCFVLHKLGLKDVYAKQGAWDKYRVGSRLGQSAEKIKRYGNR